MHEGCVSRICRRVETDTDFVVEYSIPIHGNILVAFKDEVLIPGQEGMVKIVTMPVADLLNRAKVALSRIHSSSIVELLVYVRTHEHDWLSVLYTFAIGHLKRALCNRRSCILSDNSVTFYLCVNYKHADCPRTGCRRCKGF